MKKSMKKLTLKAIKNVKFVKGGHQKNFNGDVDRGLFGERG